jgi:hypothetical protein
MDLGTHLAINYNNKNKIIKPVGVTSGGDHDDAQFDVNCS